jgi:hypothetical protein
MKRAQNEANFMPAATREIESQIPDELKERLTAHELALVMRAMDAHWHRAIAFRNNEIINEGCIWDPEKKKLRDLQQ